MLKRISTKLFRVVFFTSLIILIGLLSACGGTESLADSADNDPGSDAGSSSVADAVDDANASNNEDDSDTGDLVSAAATDTPEPPPEPTAEPTPDLPPVPDSFSIFLEFEADTECGYDGFAYDYDIALTADTITIYQIAVDITLTGPYDPITGDFTAEVGDLPGTEIYRGTIAMDGTTVLIDGEYSYVLDPDDAMMCIGLWPYSGAYTP